MEGGNGSDNVRAWGNLMSQFLKRAFTAVALSVIFVIVGSMTYEYVVPSILDADIPGVVASIPERLNLNSTFLADAGSGARKTGKDVASAMESVLSPVPGVVVDGPSCVQDAISSHKSLADCAEYGVPTIPGQAPTSGDEITVSRTASGLDEFQVHDRVVGKDDLTVSGNSQQTSFNYRDSGYTTKLSIPYEAVTSGAITKLIDGDTLDVNSIRVRLSLVDTPEIGEAGYEEASAFVRVHCPLTSTALYDPDAGQPEGSHDRIIGMVWCSGAGGNMSGVSLNQMLLDEGHAVVLTRHCSTSEFGAEPWAKKYGC